MEQALIDATRPFDAILMDIFMERSDGAQVCQRLRELNGARLPIIAMTGHTSEEHRRRFEAMGFDLVRLYICVRLCVGCGNREVVHSLTHSLIRRTTHHPGRCWPSRSALSALASPCSPAARSEATQGSLA